MWKELYVINKRIVKIWRKLNVEKNETCENKFKKLGKKIQRGLFYI